MDPRVSFRAHYDRLPASVKGAFVLRGADGKPHQVRFRAARLSGLGGEVPSPLPLEGVTLDIAPTLDTFVPFEVPTLDLGPGWYAFECEVSLDGDAVAVRPGEPFAVAWPRGQMRRGAIAVGSALGDRVRVEQVDCHGDHVKVSYASEGPAELRLSSGGRKLAPVSGAFVEDAGKGHVTAYPVRRDEDLLTIEVRGAALDVKLP